MAPKRTCECGTCGKCKHREYMNEYYRRDPQKIRDSALASRARRIEQVRAYDRARGNHNSNPAKIRARKLVFEAVLAGTLVRGGCVTGGECRGRIEGHHEDYDKPLEVVWLCQKHHAERHRRIAA